MEEGGRAAEGSWGGLLIEQERGGPAWREAEEIDTAASGSARHGASDGPVATVTGSFCKNPPVALFLYNFSGIL